MIIDASLGRNNSCGCGCDCGCGTYPTCPTIRPDCGTGGSNAPDAFTVQLATAVTALPDGATLPLSGTVRISGNGLSYDSANCAVVINEAGVYHFSWDVLTQSTSEELPIVIALQSLDGATVLAYSGTAAADAAGSTLVSGETTAALAAGTAWVLVNRSGAAINLPAAGTPPTAFTAQLTVTEV